MVRCPVCTEVQVAYVEGPTRTSCYYCGARWIQQGVEQEAIIAQDAPESALRSMGHGRTALRPGRRERVGTLEASTRVEGST